MGAGAGARAGFSPGKSAAARPPRRKEVPGKKGGSPHRRAGSADEALPRGPSPPPVRPAAAADDGRGQSGSGVRGRGEAAAAARCRRGHGAERKVVVKSAGDARSVAARENSASGGGEALTKHRPEPAARPPPKERAVAREKMGSGGGQPSRKQPPEPAARPTPKRSAVSREEWGSRGAEDPPTKRWPESDAHPPPKRVAVSAMPRFSPGCAPLATGEGYSRSPSSASRGGFCASAIARSEEHGLPFEASPGKDAIPYDSTHGKTEAVNQAIITVEASVGRSSDESKYGNTSGCQGKTAAGRVAEDAAETMNKLGESKIVSDGHGSSSKGKECAATIREPFASRKALEVKGQARSNHLPSNVATESALVKKDKLKDKESMESTILGYDDILKQLAIHDGRVEWNHKVLDRLSPALVDVRSAKRMLCGTFRSIYSFIARAVEQGSLNVGRVDFEADQVIRELRFVIRHDPIVGNVPGVEVGDEFLHRAELALVGLHLPPQAGIGFTKDGKGVPIAVSVIASGRYPDEMSKPDEIIYFGSGGKPAGKKVDEDQKLELGNLALKKCIEKKTPVRLIHGLEDQDREENSHSRAKQVYAYGGLYLVVDFCRDDLSGSRVFKYVLKRIPGQPELPPYIVEKLIIKSPVRPGLLNDDIPHSPSCSLLQPAEDIPPLRELTYD